MFILNDMIHLISIISMVSACTNLSYRPTEIFSYKENTHKARKTEERMLKPIYICLGVIILLFGGLAISITCVMALRKKLWQTSLDSTTHTFPM